jgi:hypothetical protein
MDNGSVIARIIKGRFALQGGGRMSLTGDSVSRAQAGPTGRSFLHGLGKNREDYFVSQCGYINGPRSAD